MRLDECSQPTLDDIELGERSRRVVIRQGKGNKARVVPLNASARQALAEYLDFFNRLALLGARADKCRLYPVKWPSFVAILVEPHKAAERAMLLASS